MTLGSIPAPARNVILLFVVGEATGKTRPLKTLFLIEFARSIVNVLAFPFFEHRFDADRGREGLKGEGKSCLHVKEHFLLRKNSVVQRNV